MSFQPEEPAGSLEKRGTSEPISVPTVSCCAAACVSRVRLVTVPGGTDPVHFASVHCR